MELMQKSVPVLKCSVVDRLSAHTWRNCTFTTFFVWGSFWSGCISLNSMQLLSVKRNLDHLNFLSWVHHWANPTAAALTAHCHLHVNWNSQKKKFSQHFFVSLGSWRDPATSVWLEQIFLDFVIEEKVYLCVQILSLFFVFRWMWKGGQVSQFSINFFSYWLYS